MQHEKCFIVVLSMLSFDKIPYSSFEHFQSRKSEEPGLVLLRTGAENGGMRGEPKKQKQQKGVPEDGAGNPAGVNDAEHMLHQVMYKE